MPCLFYCGSWPLDFEVLLAAETRAGADAFWRAFLLEGVRAAVKGSGNL